MKILINKVPKEILEINLFSFLNTYLILVKINFALINCRFWGSGRDLACIQMPSDTQVKKQHSMCMTLTQNK